MNVGLRARTRAPFGFGRIVLAASAALAFTLGCSAATEPSARESTAFSASAEVGTLPARTMTCTMADVGQQGDPSSATFKCTGPWQYQDYAAVPCTKVETNAQKCGTTPKTCTAFTTCQHVEFGLVSTINPPMGGSQMTAKWIPQKTVCDPDWTPSPGSTLKPCHTVPGYYDYAGTCSAYANSNLASGLSKLGVTAAQAAASYGTRAIYSVDSTNGASMMCNYGVQSYPVFNARAQAPCATYNYDCSTANTCRPTLAAGGVLEPDPGACGISVQSSLSDTQKMASEVLATDPYAAVKDARFSKCMTCDGLPATTPAQISAKHDCLASALSSLHDNATHLPTVQRLEQDLRLLVELQGANLTAAQQAISLNAFEDKTATPDTCNTAWTRPDGVTCTGDERTTIEAALNVCAQITLPEIKADARSQFVEHCTDDVRAMPGLYDCEGYLQAYMDIMSKLENVLQQYAVTPRDQALLQKVRAVLGS